MSYSKTITENDLKEVFTWLGVGVSFGQTYEAAWTATSTNSTPQRCTDSISLPKGKYIGVIKLPITSQESTLFFGINDMSITIGGMVSKSQSSIPIIFEVDTDNRETYVVTGMSAATTYTYTELGYLKVICISDMKQYRTTVLDYYPVGSYYETSDSTFDPNDAWGGRWDLETEGKVHISGSNNGSYKAGSSYGSNTKSYTPSGTVGTTKLSDANIAHGHTVTQPAFTGPSHYHSGPAHTHNVAYKEANRTGGGSAGTRMGPYGTTASGVSPIATSSAGTGNTGNAGTGACTRTTNVGVADLSGASSTRTAHGHGFTGTTSNLDMMQDSIAVYRWHRTA